ncbi:hypothetical protein N0M98_19165 [Paenibacillus doosanensis]|uniref:hypothetical protein n=1 Tax=Paenibacillus doosanensis TaxID=1229154 RepID=UPI0021807378|nr:hypothetical protein [Paenibacillus doosanensis]MCS7462265.1 hypothetical protein [Paenibacillus doosanensis]
MSNEEREFMTKEVFFTVIEGKMIGVYLSSEGPKMFMNQEVFDLRYPCWDVEMVMGKNSHLLSFYWYGEVKFSFRCGFVNDLFLSLYDYLSCRLETRRLA